MKNKDKIINIVEKLNYAEGFMLGMKVLGLLDRDINSKIGQDLYNLKCGINIAKINAVELYQQLDPEKES